MKITHYKGEHRFLAVWALQQYGIHLTSSDDENDDDDSGSLKKKTSHGHLPKEMVRKVVEYLLAPPQLLLVFDLRGGAGPGGPPSDQDDTKALQGTIDFLCKTFLEQPQPEVFHEPSQTMFAPLVWGRAETTVTTPDGGEQTQGVAWPSFIGRGGAVPDWYAESVATHARIDPAHEPTIVEAVRGATVLTATEADVDDYKYYPVFHDLHERDRFDVDVDKAREILDVIDAFTRGRGKRWGQVYFALHRIGRGSKVVVRNPLNHPNMDNRGTVLFANFGQGSELLMVGEDPRLRDEGLVLLRSEDSDGPPRVSRGRDQFHDDTFSVYTLIEAALKTKSHKAENWYEMYGKVDISEIADRVYLDLDFDYGS